MEFKQTYRQGGKFVLYTCAPWMVAFGEPTRQILGKSVGPFSLFFQGDTSSVLYEKKRFDAVAMAAVEKFSTPNELNAHYRRWLLAAQQLDAFSWATYHGQDISYAHYWNTFVDFWARSVFIDCFDAGVDFNEMDRIAADNGLNRAEVQLLSTPLEPSYVQQIGMEASKAALNATDPADFVRQFFWYPTNYVEFGGLDENDARAIISSHSDHAQRTLDLFQETQASLSSRQQQVLDEKGMDQNPMWLYQALMAWRDLRKRYNFSGLYGFDRMARDVLLTEKIPAELFTGLWPEEVLSGDLPSEKLLRQRIDHGTLALMETQSYELIVGPLAHKQFAKMERTPQSAAMEIRGQVACLGRIQAPVRIVRLPSDRFVEGEILVTIMTRPEFVPLMKKAAGIITDEGGITSHAAVVSRELNVPCIVGTQEATRRLKTGDIVELDAFHGLVRKVSYRSPSQT